METRERPSWSSRAWSVAATVVLLVVLAVLTIGAREPGAGAVVAVATAVVVGVTVWAVARTRAQRRAYEERLTEWAAEGAAQAERLRIARDLHDLASHGIGLITVRAASARAAAAGDPAEMAAALTDVEQVSRETTTELRRMLTVLREPVSGATDGPAPLRPAETLADLPRIVHTAEEAGLAVAVDLPEVAHVSPGVQLTVCAVVREALNNALRHAGPTRVAVTMRRDQDALVVTVHDAGPHPGWRAQPGAGHGLLGLRERVTALDGSLTARPDGAGFLVHARVPDRTPA